jgi:hypothetical protein
MCCTLLDKVGTVSEAKKMAGVVCLITKVLMVKSVTIFEYLNFGTSEF